MGNTTNGTPDRFGAFRALRNDGFGLVDVGARGGVNPLFTDLGGLVRVLGFEPDPEECARLNARSRQGGREALERYLPCALGAVDGEQVLHVCRSPGATSRYRPNEAWVSRFPEAERFQVTETRRVPVRALDSLVRETPRGAIDFLKIDVQGAALDVLRGATHVLRTQAVGVEVEVEFAPIYESQPLFRDVDAFLSAQGFSLFKLRRLGWVRRAGQHRPRWSAGQLIAGDALYLRDPLDRGPEGRHALTPHQLEALVLLASVYDLADLALEALAETQVEGVDHEGLRQFVEQAGRGTGVAAALGRVAWQCVCGRPKAGLRYLQAWNHRKIWGRIDGDHEFYTMNLALRS